MINRLFCEASQSRIPHISNWIYSNNYEIIQKY